MKQHIGHHLLHTANIISTQVTEEKKLFLQKNYQKLSTNIKNH